MHKKLTIILNVGIFISLAAGGALGQMVAPLPGAPPLIQVQPNWRPIPGVPGVQYVPTLRQDMFRYQNNYYCWHDGRWFYGQNHGGPWRVIQNPPPVFTQIAPNYWKTPPGWDHGNKTGWRGRNLPPGQYKKLHQPVGPAAGPYAGGHVTPSLPAAPVVAGIEGPGKGKKGGSHAKMKHQGEDWGAVPIDSSGQGGPPDKGRGKFK